MHSRAVLIGIAFGVVATTIAWIIDLGEVLWPRHPRESLFFIGIIVASATWAVAERDFRRMDRMKVDQARVPKRDSNAR